MTTTTDGDQDTASAGPVLPNLPAHPCGEFLGDCWSNPEVESIRAYGRQCAEHVTGPLREQVAKLEAERSEAASLSHQYRNEAERQQRRVAELERDVAAYKAGSNEVAAMFSAVREDRDRLRAESVIEWEPGRSYTAAELLRRAIRVIRMRKDRSLCPPVENLFGVGNTVARYLCRWAGRDPDTGADMGAKQSAGETR